MNEQEAHWAGKPGDDYTARNQVSWHSRINFWKHILDVTGALSVLDVGCNAGWNGHAIRQANARVAYVGIDVNEKAIAQGRDLSLNLQRCRALDIPSYFGSLKFDLVCTSGVLIHVPPADLTQTMQSIIDVSREFVLAVEYRDVIEQEVVYRGQRDRLWRRPYGKLYSELGLNQIDSWNADGFDRCTYWLMVKP
jgi:SAM-dependent methyltransferase